ncbi:MAG: DEAD/DEAH box helicase [Geodermatophilaceae bacterium]
MNRNAPPRSDSASCLSLDSTLAKSSDRHRTSARSGNRRSFEARALNGQIQSIQFQNQTTSPDHQQRSHDDAVALEHATEGAPEVLLAEELAARAPVTDTAPLFTDFDVHPDITAALADVGITRTFAIQELTLPIALAGHDLIGQARTGTGKTLGFGVPMLQRLTNVAEGADGMPQALVVVPTRELCVQVARDLSTAGSRRGIRVQAIYGGRAYEPQIEALRKGVEIVVGTPGRLLDLAEQRHLMLGSVSVLVLDEADEMLDLGFLPDIQRVLSMVPTQRQTMLFSATMPGPIVTLARQFMTQPTHIRAHGNDEGSTVPDTTQYVYRAHNLDKPELLARLLQATDRSLTMVFCRTKRTAQKVADELVDRGFAAAAVHGDLGQGAREQALRAFRSGKVDVLVATDVAARGIDVTGVSHVVNYQCPEDEKTYLHRIGRTGRAGGKGIAVTLVDWDDLPRWSLINTALDLPFHEPPETYSTSEHYYTDLGIPASATGRLPRSARTREGLSAEQLEDVGETGRGRGGSGGSGRSGSGGPGGRGHSAGSDRSSGSNGGRGRSGGRVQSNGRTDDATRGDGRPSGEQQVAGDEPARRPRRSRSRNRTRGGLAVVAEGGRPGAGGGTSSDDSGAAFDRRRPAQAAD